MKHFLLVFLGISGLLQVPGRSLAQIANPVPGGIPGQPTPPTAVIPQQRKTLDDTTKQIYGPRTTRYFLEPDVFNNRKTLYQVDTAYEGFYQYRFVERANYRLVDLGLLGSATRSTYYEPPGRIGVQLGFNAHNPYDFPPETFKYYDTKSPFSNIYYAQGGRGQNLLSFDLSRNVSPLWNVGFDVQRITADRQYNRLTSLTSNNQNQIGNWTVALHSNYHSKDEKYTVLGHVRLMEHLAVELGGVSYPDTISPYSVFNNNVFSSVTGRTPSARTRERRNVLHTYQQYALANGFQLYHILDLEGRYYRYRDVAFRSNSGAYPNPDRVPTNFDTLSTETRYLLVENRAGIKGFFNGFNYRIHLRQRNYSSLNQYRQYTATTFVDSLKANPYDPYGINVYGGQSSYVRRSETFLGIWLNYYFPDSSRRVWAEGEYLLGKDYLLRGEYESDWLTLGVSSVFSSPTLVQQRFVGRLLSWDNRFSNVSSQNAWARARFQLGTLVLRPNVSYNLLKNYIYFDTVGVPQQTAVPVNLFRAGLGVEWRLGRFSTLSEVQMATTSGADVVRLPGLMVNSRLAFDILFKKRLYIHTGLQLHYKSRYRADAWQPLTGQFGLQNSFQAEGYLLADAFADLRINRVRLFVKFSNLGQGLLAPGYFPTPNYPGTLRAFGFGVNWLLFD